MTREFTYNAKNESRYWNMADFGVEDILVSIQEDEKFKRNVTAHPSQISVNEETGGIVIADLLGSEEFKLNDWSKSQFCGKMNGLTPKYWDSCPHWLKAANGNHWLEQMTKAMEEKNKHSKMLFRVRDGGVDSDGMNLKKSIRGIMTERYTEFDDIKLMEMLLTILEDKELDFRDMKIAKYHRNDGGFHIKLLINEPIEIGTMKLSPNHKPRKDVHYRGILIENSEVGRKSIRIKPFIWRQICTNGLVAYKFDSDRVFKQRHIGIGEVGMREAVAQAMGEALEATQEVIDRLKKAKESAIVEKEQAWAIMDRHSKEFKYDKNFTALVKEHYKKELQNAFGIVQAYTEAVQKFSPYANIDDRVRIETDSVKLLERLTA